MLLRGAHDDARSPPSSWVGDYGILADHDDPVCWGASAIPNRVRGVGRSLALSLISIVALRHSAVTLW